MIKLETISSLVAQKMDIHQLKHSRVNLCHLYEHSIKN